MKNIIDELKIDKIIDKEDIIKLRKNINEKYPENTKKDNADLLSNHIRSIINEKLKEFDDRSKDNIRTEVIKNTLLNNKNEINKLNIFETCIHLIDKTPNFKEQLNHWINSNNKISISQEKLENYITEVKQHENNNKIQSIKDVEFIYKDKLTDNSEISQRKGIDEKLILKKNQMSFIYKINPYIKDIKELFKRYYVLISVFILLLGIGSAYSINDLIIEKDKNTISTDKIEVEETKEESIIEVIERHVNEEIEADELAEHSFLPEYFNYKSVKLDKLFEYLNDRNSLLAQEPYFSTIIFTAKEFNLNPLILFAITGQEQRFVPKEQNEAYKIANNPFNVFHSWQDYNTDIKDTSRIAARTIINLSVDRPEDEDPFKWINKEYAEDEEWGSGVKEIFENLIEATK